MRSYEDLTEEEQREAVSEAFRILTTTGPRVATAEQALNAAEEAFYPEYDDKLMFLRSTWEAALLMEDLQYDGEYDPNDPRLDQGDVRLES